jgi:hypothetical protein
MHVRFGTRINNLTQILDASFQHIDEYKIFKISHYVMQYSLVLLLILVVLLHVV